MRGLKELQTVQSFKFSGVEISSCIQIKEDGIYLPLPFNNLYGKIELYNVKIATPEQITEIYDKFIKPHLEVTNG